jgi:hypothetical protein
VKFRERHEGKRETIRNVEGGEKERWEGDKKW